MGKIELNGQLQKLNNIAQKLDSSPFMHISTGV